jgi:hypothetical protein
LRKTSSEQYAAYASVLKPNLCPNEKNSRGYY